MTTDYRDIITIKPGKRGGKPRIRGLRITFDDILACFAYAADRERRSRAILP